MTGFMIYMPLYFQIVHHLTPTQAGLALIPVIVMTTPGSMASGRAMMHLNRYKLSPYVGMVLRDPGRRRARRVAGHAGAVGGDRDRDGRLRRRQRVPDRHRLRAERGVAARGRHRDRRA